MSSSTDFLLALENVTVSFDEFKAVGADAFPRRALEVGGKKP